MSKRNEDRIDGASAKGSASQTHTVDGLSNKDLLVIGIGILSLVLAALALGATIG
jgi:hypothetical protein